MFHNVRHVFHVSALDKGRWNEKKTLWTTVWGVHFLCNHYFMQNCKEAGDDDDDEEEEEEEEEEGEREEKKNILPDEWRLLFEEYQQRKTKSL